MPACDAPGCYNPDAIYELLVTSASHQQAVVSKVLLGLNWTVVEVGFPDGSLSQGLCFSPVDGTRALAWPGTLAGTLVLELIPWVRSWNPCEAAVGAAVINAVVNSNSPLLAASTLLDNGFPPHLKVFGHFAPQLRDQRVAIIGHYPEMERLKDHFDYQCIERVQKPGDYPDVAAEYLLPKAEWVFITASSIANKTLPHLLQLSQHARVVLMGPSLPWLCRWKDFGVNYLAGVEVLESEYLQQVAIEGGGTRIFSSSVNYRLLAL